MGSSGNSGVFMTMLCYTLRYWLRWGAAFPAWAAAANLDGQSGHARERLLGPHMFCLPRRQGRARQEQEPRDTLYTL